ncbi:hypothetical protein COCOBI_13-0920 [Coccomyxa sp. Obi]|nr:hypothetical protein COCOBI_13-0920 [Coccomyxa sp. Obi]
MYKNDRRSSGHLQALPLLRGIAGWLRLGTPFDDKAGVILFARRWSVCLRTQAPVLGTLIWCMTQRETEEGDAAHCIISPNWTAEADLC